MRVLFVVAFVLACTPATPTPSPSPQASEPFRVGAPCAPALQALKPTTAEVTLLPHNVGPHLLFGFDGGFVSTAYGYPLGATRHWRALDASGNTIRAYELTNDAYLATESPDGERAISYERDASGSYVGIHERNGTVRVASVGSRRPAGWIDAYRLLMDDTTAPNTYHVLDTRTLVDEVVFTAPAPPMAPASDEADEFTLSGDLRWAVLTRFHMPEGGAVSSYLYDVGARRYANVAMPLDPSKSPSGDVAVWLDGRELRAMHLCDQRVVTLASLGATGDVEALTWSADGRYLCVSFGRTDEQTPPRRVLLADLGRGVVAELPAPWGFIEEWSPGDEIAVLWRYGFHDPQVRLARVTLH